MLEYQLIHPHIAPPPGSNFFDLHGTLQPVGVGTGQVLASYRVNTAYKGWLRKLAITSEDFSLTTFGIYLSDSRAAFYETINVELGTTSEPSDVWIQLNSGVNVQLRVDVTAVAAIRWRLQGWIYPADTKEI